MLSVYGVCVSGVCLCVCVYGDCAGWVVLLVVMIMAVNVGNCGCVPGRSVYSAIFISTKLLRLSSAYV